MNFVSNTGHNLVFLFGLPRSGTTLTSLIMGSHPQILAPPEPWFLLKLMNICSYCDKESIFDDYQASLGSNEFLTDFVFLKAARSFACAAYNHYLQENGKSIFLDKTPRYFHILDSIDKLFPDAKKIWLKRNLLDVATSYRDTWNVDVDYFFTEQPNPLGSDLLKGPFKLADYFNEKDRNKLEIQYESLTKEPEKVIRKVCAFLSISYNSSIINGWHTEFKTHKNASMGDKKIFKTRKIHNLSVGNWQKKLSHNEIQRLIEGLGAEIFIRMGYGDTISQLSKILL